MINGFAAIIGGLAGAFIYYCEALQFLPLTPIGLAGRLGIAAVLSGVICLGLFLLLRRAFRRILKQERIPLLLVSLILSVCVMLWFPVPGTGLYPEHTLIIRALPDDNGEIRPVTLTWIHRLDRDISLSSVRCEGNCSLDDEKPTILDGNTELSWRGKTGDVITLEFLSGADRGIAEINWDGISRTAALNNEEFSHLSFEHAFPPANGFPEFAAVWLLGFMLCFAAVLSAVKLLPGWNFYIFAAAAFVCFITFRVLQFRTADSPLSFVDSEFYLGQSRLPLSDLLKGIKYCRIEEWHCLSRPVLVPLVYKACRQDLSTIAIVQLVCSLLSWGFFAFHAAGLCRTDIRRKLTFILSLGLGCVPNVTRWDQMIMSESLSISAGVLMMGSLFWLTSPREDKKWPVLPAFCTAFSALLFAHSRDSASWSLLLVIVLLLCIMRQRSSKKVLLCLVIVMMLICAQILMTTGDRWVYAYENVLFTRILNDPAGESFFIKAGMPMPRGIEELYGKEHAMTNELFNSEAFKPLRDWIMTDGLKTYVLYILNRPNKYLRMTWHTGFEAEAFEKITYTFTPFGFRQLLPDEIIKFFSCNLPAVMMIGLAFAGIFTAFRTKDGERYAFPLLFILSAYLLATATFIADSYELDRHIICIVIMMKASAWPLITMLTEEQIKS